MEKQPAEINGIKIPDGYVFDKIENGEIKLKKLVKNILTHRDILNEESGGAGFLLTHEADIKSTLLSTSNGRSAIDFVSKIDAEKAKSYIAILRIADYYNKHYANNWMPDFNNPDQVKHCVGYDARHKTCIVFASIASSYGSPVFATEELTKLAYENNKIIFETYCS